MLRLIVSTRHTCLTSLVVNLPLPNELSLRLTFLLRRVRHRCLVYNTSMSTYAQMIPADISTPSTCCFFPSMPRTRQNYHILQFSRPLYILSFSSLNCRILRGPHTTLTSELAKETINFQLRVIAYSLMSHQHYAISRK